MFKEFRKDAIAHIPKCSSRMTAKRVGREEGFDVLMIMVNLPAIVSSRVLFLTQYQVEMEDGSIAVFMSTKGNEPYEEKYYDDIYWYVVAEEVSMTRLVPCEDGVIIE